MRIAFLAYRGTMKSGGLGIYLRDLLRELLELGHEIDLFVGPPYPDPFPGVRIHYIHNEQYWDRRFTPSWRAPLPAFGSPLGIFAPLTFFELAATRFGFLPEPFAFSVRAARAVIGEMRRGRHFDLVHDVQTLGYGLLWLRALGLPAVSTIHHPLTIDRRSSLARDRTFREKKGTVTFYPVTTQGRVARRIDALITSSDASVRELERGFRVRREKIHNVANGVGLPAPGEIRTPPAECELLFFGRSRDPNKGFEHLLHALRLLPDHVRLRVLDDPPARGELPLYTLIADLKLQDRVRFDGKVPQADLEHAVRTASAVVVPSLFEGFGLPAVEALAAGTPLVAAAAGALPEVVRRAGTGTLVRPGSPESLARGIEDTLRNWAALQREAVEARASIERAFSWEQVAARTVQVYRRAIAARRAGRQE